MTRGGMQSELTGERQIFLSTELADRRDLRLARIAIGVSVVTCAALLPFSSKSLGHAPSFIPAYESALVLCDLITAVLLFSQFNVSRSRPLYVLACGYLFTAVIAFAHALTFPDVFSPAGLLDPRSQSTAWLYVFWHGGFPLFLLAYALLKDDQAASSGINETNVATRKGAGLLILAGVAFTVVAVGGLTL